ncbi:MAG: hypothetical protein EXQ70_02135 [Solirubrobacterales bacterium]|nr:hypothetical protein [Solirubrobacterales bacterium]
MESGPVVSAAAKRGIRVSLRSTSFGKALVHSAGRAFYLFDLEKKGKKPRCYGDCARAWPPVITKGKPRAGPGVPGKRLGTVPRTDGRRQLTYLGRPLYYYVDDTRDQILCHDVFEFGGNWLLIDKSGRPL